MSSAAFVPNFVLEIGVEELPARFLEPVSRELEKGFAVACAERLLDVDEVRVLATPRRVALMARGLAETQRAEVEEVTGPPEKAAYKDGQPTKAAEGFCRTHGLSLDDAYLKDTDKGRYLAAQKTVGGGRTAEILPGLCAQLIEKCSFPKKMRWGSGSFAFGRPLRWLFGVLGETPLCFEMAGLDCGMATMGHRVMGPGPFTVDRAEDYLDVVRDKGRVVLDPAERRELILAKGRALAEAQGGSVVWKDSLLDEVVGLAEHPVPVLGGFDGKFLELPRQVLLTSMEKHQKCFGVEDSKGALKPLFLTTLNLVPKDEDLVRRGWERVLRARLEDARFFWEADAAAELSTWLDKLEDVTFLAALGSMGDKARRLERLCGKLAERLRPAIKKDMERAGRLAKTDLVSEMVGEFDSLQGVMGGIYARDKGENEIVADALAEQYLPAGPESPVPGTLQGKILSLADRADTLAGCFGLDMAPTGANDPYALRRAVLGICRTALALGEEGLRLDLMQLVAEALDGYHGVDWKLSREDTLGKLEAFVAGRLKAHFAAEGFATLAVEAAVAADIRDVWGLKLRLEALEAFSKEPDFEQAVLTFKRAANIIAKQAQAYALDGAYDAACLEEDAEKALAASLEAFIPRFNRLWEKDDFAGIMEAMRELRPAVDGFFDNVMVMCEDEALKVNRLNLLWALVSRLRLVADFGALQV